MLGTTAALHVLAATVWVGGMFFAYCILRPVLTERAGSERIAIWYGAFRRFFLWVAGAIVVLFATGYVLIFQGFGGFAGVGVHVHVMHTTALVMVLLFVWLMHGPWRRFQAAKSDGDGERAAIALGSMRRIIVVNLTLGVVTVAVASGGSWWHGGI